MFNALNTKILINSIARVIFDRSNPERTSGWRKAKVRFIKVVAEEVIGIPTTSPSDLETLGHHLTPVPRIILAVLQDVQCIGHEKMSW